jgi:hypothetical protein
MSKVDHTFAIAAVAHVQDGDALASVKAAYNQIATAFSNAQRVPALVEVRVYATPKDSNG